ncbi:Signal transduction histidine kinase [Mucilaginibacter gossypiicola]|uniref:histidine kinase n=1 Tax=Mucilaginibacter gossypiicola TaxID=551995 RepID=A0A1H8LQG8_9SPHI|nr:response regulator [Mucilaginibacter gossypiicola]SEO07377.1 Signal transduction histidine kinase [Mucilaginibacter gossypiicola]
MISDTLFESISRPFYTGNKKGWYQLFLKNKTIVLIMNVYKLFRCFANVGIYLLIMVLGTSKAGAQQNSLKFSYLTVDEGLSHTDIKEVKQDKLGFIWIATLFGLDRYDGHEIKKFYNTTVSKNYSVKNRIRSMCLDENDRLWLGSEDGIQFFDPRSEKYTNVDNAERNTGKKTYTRLIALKGGILATIADKKFRIFTSKGNLLTEVSVISPFGVNFSDMMADDRGNIWLSGSQGLWILDRAYKFRYLGFAGEKQARNLLKIFQNRNKQLIIVDGTSVILTKEGTGILQNGAGAGLHQQKRRLIPGCSTIHDVLQDKNLDYWICTDGGLFLLDKNFNIKQTITSRSFVNSLNTNYLDKIFIDRSECLWVCTFGDGLNFCDLNAKLFYTFQRNPEVSNTLSGNHIRSVLEESGHIVWVGTNANGLNKYDYKTKMFIHFNADEGNARLKSNEVDALELDNDNNLWVGSDRGIDIINKRRDGLFRPSGFKTFPGHSLASLSRDCFGNIWFGSYYNGYGVILKDKNQNYKVIYKGPGSGYMVKADKNKPEVLVSSIDGLQRLHIDSQGNVIRKYRYRVNNRSNSLSSDYLFPVQKQGDKAYWIGTIGGGLDYLRLENKDAYSVKVFDGKYGVFNDVEAIEIDGKGNVWMGGNGLERFDVRTKQLTRFDKNDGLQSNSFKVGASFKGEDGRLYFGGINGLNYFFPDSIKLNEIPARPIFTDLLINNKSTHIDQNLNSENSLPVAIPYARKLVLNYLQNNFVISFSAMHYANSAKCRYRYKLLGFDKEWQYTSGKNPAAAYTNLDYNSYSLVLEATNNDGIWSKNKASLDIEIIAPWWKSSFARGIYLILILSVLIGIYIYQARWFRLKKELAVRDVEERKREEMHLQREELYQQQLQFFTNISHEFRTPLTLILGPLENLILENSNAIYRHTFQIMHRNAKRLINLINELMNFRKVADNAINLRVTPVKIDDFVTGLYEEFKESADNSRIEFFLKIVDTRLVYIDKQVLEKILFNLLNNAFKYTASGGMVTLEVFADIGSLTPLYQSEFKLINKYRADHYIFFRIADTGIGISADSIGQIFDRYYRINNNHIGSGIGLALVKNLTLLHKGDIYVYSERHAGTEIIIALPSGEQNYSSTEKWHNVPGSTAIMLESLDISVLSERAIQPPPDSYTPHQRKQHILLVEDNDELRSFLKETLEKQYFVYEAVNGQRGYEIAVEHIPDLIISDVMMPVMNGVELCRQVKAAFETSHIPFLFLSAKSALEARLEGLESGADFYIAKPVSIELLMLTINNLFEQKRKLKLKYTQDYYAEATELVHSTQDKEFLDKLIGLIEKNIHNQELDVDFLCNNMFTSRSKLYKKIKSISGQSINEFVRTIRLKRAAHIMTHEDVTQNEIIDRIGILSVSYFQKAFRKEFGKTPSQFIQSIKRS